MHKESEMHEYQKRVADAIVAWGKIACWLDCGLGKTIIAMTAVRRLLDEGRIHSVLVIAPKSVCENVWAQEAVSWEHTKNLRVSIIAGNASERLKAADVSADIYVVSRDNFAWLSETNTRAITDTDMLILDESTSFKHRNKRWKALCQRGKRKRPLFHQYRYIVLLSGSPASESYEGLWAQMYILDGGQRLGKSITRFRQTYMECRLIHNRLIYTDFKPWAIKAIDDLLKDICISMKKEDYLQLPERIDIIRWTGYEPCPTYRAMERDGVVEVDGVHVLSVEPTVKYGKLRQLCSGHIYDELRVEHSCNDKKEQTMQELLEELQNENVLVFYQYDFEREFLQRECGAELIDTPAQQRRWNDGLIRVACAHPASLGYGINLQHGGNTVIWYSLPLSYEQYVQGCDRLHRQGQQHTVKVIHLVGKHTIEEKIYALLKEKKANLLQSLMDAMKYKF